MTLNDKRKKHMKAYLCNNQAKQTTRDDSKLAPYLQMSEHNACNRIATTY